MKVISKTVHKFARREFLKLLSFSGGMVALSAWLQACSSLLNTSQPPLSTEAPSPTAIHTTQSPTSTTPPTNVPTDMPTQTSAPTSIATTPPDIARLVLVRTTDRTAGIRKAIDLFGIQPFQDRTVFIKANYNSADPAPASTHLDTLRALVGKIRELGAGSITLGERSGMGNTRLALETMGVLALASELGFDILVLDELEKQDWVHIDSEGDHWSEGFYLPDALFQAGAVVQTCCLKTHRFGGHFTMSLKNSVGLVANSVLGISHNFMTELHSSPYQRDMIAEINLSYQPALIVLDGVKAFTSGGPDTGNLVEPGVILAGTDRVAMDAVGVAILRDFGVSGVVAKGKIFEQDQIRRAVELGIGVGSPDKIELVTGDDASRTYADKLKEILFD